MMICIINGSSGPDPQRFATLRERIKAVFPLAEIHEWNDAREITECLSPGMIETGSIVVAAGGDGTVSALAAKLAGAKAVLGIIPLGTLNHFAKDLGLPMDSEAALRVIKEGVVRSVDVAEANGRIFINNSSVGLYPRLVRLRDRHQFTLRGSKGWAMFWTLISLLGHLPTVDVELMVQGRKLFRRTPFVFIGNNQYHLDGLKIGNRVRLDEGLLSIVTTGNVGRLGLLRLAFKVILGRLHADRDFNTLNAPEVQVDVSSRSQDFSFDGEVLRMQSPVDYRVRPKALQVLVSRETQRK